MTYQESEAKLNHLRSKNMIMFQMAVSHLMDVGIRHLTPEMIETTCASIMQEDDRNHFMTNEFQCALIRMAGQLAQIDHIHLLTYISRNVVYDVGDGKLSYDRLDELLRNCIERIDEVSYDDLRDELSEYCYFDESDFEALGMEFIDEE